MKRSFLIILVLLVFTGLAVSACSQPTTPPPPSKTPTATRPTSTPLPTRTFTLVPTLTPTHTLAPSATQKVTQTPTATGTYAIPNAKIISVGWYRDYDLLVTVEIPGGVKGEYTLMLEDKPFACEMQPKYADRLYCIGRGTHVNEYAQVALYLKDNKTPVYQATVTIPIP